MEDKWVGLILAVLGQVAIGISFIITKMGLNATAKSRGYESASEGLAYLRNPIWWAGISTMVLGEIGNFAAYAFAPPILVTPLGALSVLLGAVLASFFLKEELGHIGRVGCTLCLIGSGIIVLHAPEDKDIETVDEILHYALEPGFLLYCLSVLIFALVMIYTISPRYGKSNPLVYISICSLVGSVSVMAIKGFGVALKLTLNGDNQFSHPSTYVFGIVVVVCILVQMNYFNKALDTFSTNVVNPMYYVGFSTATIVASLILFQGFNTTGGVESLSLLSGFIVTFLGVHLLNLSRTLTTSYPPSPDRAGHVPLENGLMNPRLSIGGRVSLDASWSPSHTHVRRGSLYRAGQGQGLNGGWGGEQEQGQDVVLEDLREEDGMDEEGEEDGGEEDERTKLTGRGKGARRKSEGAEGGRHPALGMDMERERELPLLPGRGP